MAKAGDIQAISNVACLSIPLPSLITAVGTKRCQPIYVAGDKTQGNWTTLTVVIVTICNPFRSLVVVVTVAVQNVVEVDDLSSFLKTPLTSVPSVASRYKFANLPFLTSATIFSPVESACNSTRRPSANFLSLSFSRKSISRGGNVSLS